MEAERDARVRIAVASALVAMFAYRISTNVADPDLYHQMALAREALRSGAIPRADVFAFTPVLPTVVHHEWLSGLIALGVAAAFGGAGILAMKYALAGGIAMASVRTARAAGASFLAIAVTGPVAIKLADHGFSPGRAQLYTYLLAAVTIAMIERDRAGGRRWVAAHVFLFVPWVNLHGGFVVGPLLLACHAVESAVARRPVRHLIALIGAEALLVVANPWGTAYYSYLARALTMSRDRITEWAPLLTADGLGPHRLAFAIALALWMYGVWRSGARARPGGLLIGVSALMVLRASRMLPLFALTWFAYCSPLLVGTPLLELAVGPARRWPRATAAAMTAAALACVVQFAQRPWRLDVPNRPMRGNPLAYPVGATRFLAASGFRGNLMTTFETGAYVSWKLYPAVRVSLDGRYEAAYPAAVFEDVMAFYGGRADPGDVLSKYPADAVLVPPGGTTLRRRLAAWPVAYDDGSFAVLVRPGASTSSAPGPVAVTDRFP